MKKFLIGVVAGCILAGLTGIVMVLALARLGDTKPTVENESTLILDLQGGVPERSQVELPFPALQSKSPATVQQMWALLRNAADDPKIEAAVLMPRGVSMGWGKMQEIRDGLLKFKESGKPLIAYLRNPGAREYYLATAADKVYFAREDFLNLKGLRIEAMYLKGTLDKLGVKVEIEHAGKYKDAGDMFSKSEMSPATREVLDSVLDELYAHLLTVIAESRDLSVDAVRGHLDDGPFLASQALEIGLIDGLNYEDEMYELLRTELGHEKLRKVGYRTYLAATSDTSSEGRERIAVVVGSGSIYGGSGGGGWGEEQAIWSRSFSKVLRRVRDDESIKAVILRVDSPGGDAIASDEILREVRLLSEKKPMVISMSDVAASGGYYIAMTGDPVVAYPYTVTGSIGVIYGKVNLRGFYDKIGVQKQILKRGRFADIDSDYTPLNSETRAKLKEGIDAVYDSFLGVVSEGRDRPLEEIEPLAEGRVWLGVQAKENGLVDELGGLDRAIALVKQKAEIPEERKVQLVSYPRPKTFWEILMQENAGSLIEAAVHELRGGVSIPKLPEPGMWRLMPYQIDVE
jgi:protease IV